MKNTGILFFVFIIASFVCFAVFSYIREDNKLHRIHNDRAKKKDKGNDNDIPNKECITYASKLVDVYEIAFKELKSTFRSDIFDKEINAFLITLMEVFIPSFYNDVSGRVKIIQTVMLYIRVKKFNHAFPEDFKTLCDAYFDVLLNGGNLSLENLINENYIMESSPELFANLIEENKEFALYILFLINTHKIYRENGKPEGAVFGYAEDSLAFMSGFVNGIADSFSRSNNDKDQISSKQFIPDANKSISLITDTYCKYVKKTVRQFQNLQLKNLNANIVIETAVFFMFISDFMASKHNLREQLFKDIIKSATSNKFFSNADISVVEKRTKLYAAIVRGKIQPRGEFMIGVDTQGMSSIGKTYIAFGDIIYNPKCSNDYRNSPMLIRGITDSFEFFDFFNKHIAVLIDEYTREVSKILDS